MVSCSNIVRIFMSISCEYLFFCTNLVQKNKCSHEIDLVVYAAILFLTTFSLLNRNPAQSTFSLLNRRQLIAQWR